MEFDQHASSVTTASFENLMAMLPERNSKRDLDSKAKKETLDSNSSFENLLAMLPVRNSKRDLDSTERTEPLDSSVRAEQTDGNSDSEIITSDATGPREASRQQSPSTTETREKNINCNNTATSPASASSPRALRKGRRKPNKETDDSSVSVSLRSISSSGSRDRSKSGSYHTRMLPDRQSLDVARDTKRILEICYGSNGTIGSKEESPVPKDDNEKKEDSPLNKRPKKKKKDKKTKKKIKTSNKVEKSEKQQTATKIQSFANSDVGPLDENVEVMLNEGPKREQEKLSSGSSPSPLIPASPSTTPSPSGPSRRTVPPKRPLPGSRKRKKRIVIVRRNAAGKVIRRRIKGKGRDRVVRKEIFRKGKDAKIGLATIDEDFYDGLVGDSSEDDSQFESFRSGTDTDEFFAEDPPTPGESGSLCLDDDDNGFDSKDDDDDNDEIINATSTSAREIKKSTREDPEDNIVNMSRTNTKKIRNRNREDAEDQIVNDTNKSARDRTHEGVEGSRNENPVRKSSRNRKNGSQRTNSSANEVSSATEVSSRESLQNIRVSPNHRVPPNEVVPEPTENDVDVVPESDMDVSHITSLDSSDSTACTSTASSQNRRGSKSCCRKCFKKYRKLYFIGATFVFFVAAMTVMVVYFLFDYQETRNKNTMMFPSQPPTVDSIQRPSLRPSLQPLPSIFDSSTLAPTLTPTSVLDTLSTSCFLLGDKEEPVTTTEAEYAPEQFGLTSISNTNAGYCGEGYITGLETSGSGFGFDSIEVYTSGYYRVAIRYNNADRTKKILRLQINDQDEGTFKLVPSGNETSWLVDGIDNILLREGEHAMRISVDSVDNRKGPNVDWIALVLQKSFPKLDYLADLVTKVNGVGELQTREISTLEWMSSEDTTDWSTLTDTELIERFALIQIYHFTSGIYWKNKNQWLSEFHVCSWYGITCSKDMHVTDLMLDNNGLTGFLPKDISLLKNLILISLDNNDLKGMFPVQIGELTNLSTLMLHANFLSGVLPSDLGALENLKTIDLRNNFLYGKIPEEMYSMVKLEKLALGSNFLSGTLSTRVGELKALKDLDLQISQLSGTIPTELGELTLLTSLALGYNLFSGTIPRELGLLQKLTILDINSNKLTGFVPSELNLLEDTSIDYYGNDLVL